MNATISKSSCLYKSIESPNQNLEVQERLFWKSKFWFDTQKMSMSNPNKNWTWAKISNKLKTWLYRSKMKEVFWKN